MTTKNPRAKFIHPGSTPPVGWVYELEHEGNKYFFQSPMWLGLKDQLRNWYSAKELEWPGDAEMRARVEHHICQLVPKGFCAGGPNRPKVSFLSASAIRDATRLFMTSLFRGKGNLVPQEEADRRAKICANCPLNLHGICTSCMGNEFQDIFRWLIARGRRTPYDSVLDTCSVCGCLLKAKVHIPIEELSKLKKHTYPKNCWLHDTPCHVDSKELEE